MPLESMIHKYKKHLIVTIAFLVLSALLLGVAFLLYEKYWKQWRTSNGENEKLNISWFVFRDVNRNGIYDLEDRPYAGLRVLLKRPDGSVVFATSNINGFANFKMSASPGHGLITSEGRYRMIADLPEGWEVTSSEDTLEIGFRFLEGSPAGMVADSVADPLGVAPIPVVSGRLDNAGSDPWIYATSPSGQKINVRVNEDGVYQLSGEPGVWSMTTVDQETGAAHTKEVEIQYYPVALSKSFFSATASLSPSSTITVGFDDLTTSDSVYEIPNGYQGLNWKNWISTHNLFYRGAGYVNATLSGEYVAYNSSGHPATISSDRPFDFIGTYIGVAWAAASRGLVHVEGYRDGELVYEDTLRLTYRTPTYFHANYVNIDRLRIYSDIYWQVVLDDSRFRLYE